jgi:hypothetical protein
MHAVNEISMSMVKNLKNNLTRSLGNYYKDKKIIGKNLKLYGQYASIQNVLLFIKSKTITTYEGTK